jgi:hypothetical protein
MRQLFLILFTFIGLTVCGQESKSIENQVKFSPLRMLNYTAPGLELSYEVGYGNFSTQLSVAYLIDFVHYIKVRENLNGMRFNLEEKYFIKTTQNRKFKFYVSSEIGYNQVNFVAYERFWIHDTQEDYWANWDKTSYSVIINGKAGGQVFAGNFVVDFSVGLGVIFKNVVEFNKPQDEEMLDGVLNGILEVAGRHTFLNVPLSVKIGYRF